MARQRTPDSQRLRPFAGLDADEQGEPTTVRGWLLQRRKMLAALIGIPVTYLSLKLGLNDLLGAELDEEARAAIASLVVAAIVERIPNKRKV